MLRALIISSYLCGLGTVLVAIAYGLRREVRVSRVWAAVALFGFLGFVIASIFSAIAIVRKDDSAFDAGILWPTSIVLMAGERGDPLWATLLVFGMAILSNVGVYGFVGLVAGAIWNWLRTAPLER